MKIKEVISQTGIPEKTIRYYEERGLVTPVTERRNGRTYHEFSEEDVRALKRIVILRQARFSIEEILRMQQHPEAIPEIVQTQRVRIERETEQMKNLLCAEELTAAKDWMELGGLLERAQRRRSDYRPSLRFGYMDEETPEEKSSAIAAYQKRHNRRWWIPVIAALSVLCVFFAGCTWHFLMQKSDEVPEANGSTEGWLYYLDAKGLYRCKEDCTDPELIYKTNLDSGQGHSLLVTEDKVYLLGQELYSMNADGSGIHQYKTRYYSSYAPQYLERIGDYLLAKETSGGAFGGGGSCLVKIPVSGGKNQKLSDISGYENLVFSIQDDILYMLGQQVTAYGEAANDTEYELTLTAYDISESTDFTGDKVLFQKTLDYEHRYAEAGTAPDGSILLVGVEDELKVGRNDTISQLDFNTLEITPYAEIPGIVEELYENYCYYCGDYVSFNEESGTYENYYVRNLETGKEVLISQDTPLKEFSSQGIIVRRGSYGNGEVFLIPYP